MDTISFRTICTQNGLSVNDDQLRMLEEYAFRLLEWNKKVNLISRRDEENFWTRHILHCLGLLFKVEIPKDVHVLDLGTGGGLPGIVLKIVRPDISFTLLDSTQKKINVVNDILGSMGLTGIKATWGRAEDLGKKKEFAGRYSFVVARAVAPLKDLVRWSSPFLVWDNANNKTSEGDPTSTSKKRINGPALIAYKGGALDGEIEMVRNQSGVGPITTIDLTLSGSTQLENNDKKIVVIEMFCEKDKRQNKP
jgi:16S rRNA (guanine527-N7)-methyltransferase